MNIINKIKNIPLWRIILGGVSAVLLVICHVAVFYYTGVISARTAIAILLAPCLITIIVLILILAKRYGKDGKDGKD